MTDDALGKAEEAKQKLAEDFGEPPPEPETRELDEEDKAAVAAVAETPQGHEEPDGPRGPDSAIPQDAGVSKGAGVSPGVGGQSERSAQTPPG